MSKVLVSGGTGFIGSHLSEKLVALGHEVTIIDNVESGSLENIRSVIEKINLIKGDIKDAVIEHNSKFYQIKDIPRRRIKTVMVEDRLDGSMHVRNNGSYFKHMEIDPKLIRRSETNKKVRNRARKVYIPPKDHPWRRQRTVKYSGVMNRE